MSNLSSAAQAILDATFEHWPGGHNHPHKRVCIAAALRSAATQLRCDPNQSYQIGGITASRRQLLAIATELEAAG